MQCCRCINFDEAMTHSSLPALSLLVLAGGRATRMNGADKGLALWHGQALIAHVIKRLGISDIVISCNRSFSEYQRYGRVVADRNDAFAGPLAGMAAGLPLCRHEWVVVVACDMPCLPTNLQDQLWQARDHDQPLVVAHDGEHLQPLALLVHQTLAPDIAAAVADGRFAVHQWIKRQPHAIAHFNDRDAFRNINTIEELASY